MLRQVVTSEIIQSIGYDVRGSILEVQFRNGWIYQYDGVPPAVYNGLPQSPSHGKYLRRHIVDQFVTRRIN